MDLKPENPPTDAASIPKAVIFDTSVLSAIGKPTAPAYRATERLFLEHNITAYIPPCVIGEIHPESDPDIKLKPRILEAKNTGWMAEAKEFNELSQYNDGPKATEISDRVRTRMADGLRGVSEDEVEKTDTLLPGIAIQLLAGGEANRVGIAIKD